MKATMIKCIALLLAILLLPLCIGCEPQTSDPQDTNTDSTADETTADATDETTAEATDDTTEVETEAPYVYEQHTYSTLECTDKLKITGRSIATDKGITADWSGSGIEFRARCHGNVKVTVTSSHSFTFKLYVDGNKPTAFSVTPGTRSYLIAMGLDKGEHSFRLVKQAAVEASNSGVLSTIDAIELKGDLLDRPADAPYLIEFIGDSITCGVGSLAEDAPNAPGSYAYLCAEQLAADYSMVSISGIGLLKSTARHNGLTMLSTYSLNNYYRDMLKKYTPTRQADLVVINLNTNDKGSMTADQEEVYKATAKALLQQIRQIHGEDVKIVWVYGMMRGYNTGYCDIWADEVLAELGGEAAGYYSKELPLNTQGAASHPSTKGHQTAARVLAGFLIDKGLISAPTAE